MCVVRTCLCLCVCVSVLGLLSHCLSPRRWLLLENRSLYRKIQKPSAVLPPSICTPFIPSFSPAFVPFYLSSFFCFCACIYSVRIQHHLFVLCLFIYGSYLCFCTFCHRVNNQSLDQDCECSLTPIK